MGSFASHDSTEWLALAAVLFALIYLAAVFFQRKKKSCCPGACSVKSGLRKRADDLKGAL